MNGHTGIICTALLATILLASPLAAENHDNRYSITKTDNGFLRMNKKTGTVSLCTANGSALTCRMGADERHAYQQEIDAINTKLGALQNRMAKLENTVNSSTSQSTRKSTQTKEQEFDEALKFADKAFRHFFNLMQDIKKQPKKDAI